MFRFYVLRLLLRLSVFATILYFYLFHRAALAAFSGFNSSGPFTPVYALWLLLMFNMLLHLLPKSPLSLAGRKQFAQNYRPARQPLDRSTLRAYVRSVNQRAGLVMVIWLACHALLLPLCISRRIGPPEWILLFAAYYVADLICMLFFCPFQSWLMKCRCCLDCRIFEWNHFMMYTPLLFFKSFFSYSLLCAAFLLLAKWEITFARHPERFWPGANAALACANCQDLLCCVKRPLTGSPTTDTTRQTG